MRYRLYSSHDGVRVQRQEQFLLWKRWVWLDACGEWDNWFGREHPKSFPTKKCAMAFLRQPYLIAEVEW